jgi:hypothetical protein
MELTQDCVQLQALALAWLNSHVLLPENWLDAVFFLCKNWWQYIEVMLNNFNIYRFFF